MRFNCWNIYIYIYIYISCIQLLGGELDKISVSSAIGIAQPHSESRSNVTVLKYVEE